MDRWNFAWLAAVLLLSAAWASSHLHRITPVPLERALTSFPMEIAEWQGEDVDRRDCPLTVEGAHEELARIYRDRAGRTVNLYIAYFESQDQGRELNNYLTKVFHRTAVEVDISTPAGSLYRVNRALLKDAPVPRVAFFWYDVNGRIIANRVRAKFVTMLDTLLRGRTNGALVAVSLPGGNGAHSEPAPPHELAFIREILPITHRYLGGGPA